MRFAGSLLAGLLLPPRVFMLFVFPFSFFPGPSPAAAAVAVVVVVEVEVADEGKASALLVCAMAYSLEPNRVRQKKNPCSFEYALLSQRRIPLF